MTMICTRTHSFIDDAGQPDTITAERDRVSDNHPLVTAFPDSWRPFGLADELQVRSERVAELRKQDTRTASSEPVSRAGLAEREEERFWAQVDRDLGPAPGDPTAAERAEQAVFDAGLRQVERIDEARLREQTDDLRETWAGRLPLER